MILPYLPAHAKAQGNHIVLFAVSRAATFDVVQQGCLQGATLPRKKRDIQGLNQGPQGRSAESLGFINWGKSPRKGK